MFVRPACEPARVAPTVVQSHGVQSHVHLRLVLHAAAAAAARSAHGTRFASGTTVVAISQLAASRMPVASRHAAPALAPPEARTGRRVAVASPRLSAAAPPAAPSRRVRGIAEAAHGRENASRALLVLGLPTRRPAGPDIGAASAVGIERGRGRGAALPMPGRGAEQFRATHAARPRAAAPTTVHEDRRAASASPAGLVWRKSRPGGTPTPPDPRAHDAAGVRAPAPRAPAAAGDGLAAPGSGARAELRGPSTPAIESSMVDRLAHEVIQRIERRMRIERERRGL
jgi:hypothetical protein